jgi:transcription initiation factor TFIIIB Brf1 subunit/transcription initiation factor TFIIB
MVWCLKCSAEREGFLDPSIGNISCEVCGILIEESTIVSEITFSEDSHVVGQHVSHEGSSFNQFRTLAGSQTNSREITLDKSTSK